MLSDTLIRPVGHLLPQAGEGEVREGDELIDGLSSQEASTSDQMRSHFSGEEGWSNICSWLASALRFWK